MPGPPPLDASTWLTPPRRDQPELLDRNLGAAADVHASMQDLWRVNTLLGGVWSVTRHLSPRLQQHPPATVLDLGAGAGQVAGAIAAQHPAATVIPLDYARQHLTSTTHQPAHMPPIQADALRLPLAANSVDYVISSLFLHHFTPEQVVCILRDAFTVARRGVIMSDLMRGRVNELAWHIARPVFARSHITYHDGLISVQRAYTPTELLRFAVAAGVMNAKVYAPLPWRMTLVIDKP